MTSPWPSRDFETIRAGKTLRIELASGAVRAIEASLAAIRSRCRFPTATGGAGTSMRPPATRSVSNP